MEVVRLVCRFLIEQYRFLITSRHNNVSTGEVSVNQLRLHRSFLNLFSAPAPTVSPRNPPRLAC